MKLQNQIDDALFDFNWGVFAGAVTAGRRAKRLKPREQPVQTNHSLFT